MKVQIRKLTPMYSNQGDSQFDLPVTNKKLQIRLAVSEYRNNKWTPKRVSKDFFESYHPYTEESSEK